MAITQLITSSRPVHLKPKDHKQPEVSICLYVAVLYVAHLHEELLRSSGSFRYVLTKCLCVQPVPVHILHSTCICHINTVCRKVIWCKVSGYRFSCPRDLRNRSRQVGQGSWWCVPFVGFCRCKSKACNPSANEITITCCSFKKKSSAACKNSILQWK